jgi:hypothetical protein
MSLALSSPGSSPRRAALWARGKRLRSPPLQGWGEEGRDCSCRHAHYFLPGMAICTFVLTPWVETVLGWLATNLPWVARVLHHAGGKGLCSYLQELHWGSYPPQGIERWSLPSPLPRQVREVGFSTLASSSQHPAGGNLTTAPHHSWWNSGGYLVHPSWRANPLLGLPPGLSSKDGNENKISTRLLGLC